MTSGITLTKSNFKLGHDCLYKLKYYKANYPSKLQEDDYLAFFADCGFMVEAIAHALFADGVTPKPLPGESPQDATTRAMAGTRNGVWIEPTFVHGSFMARIDMLVCAGDAVRLIEIKAKSFDSTEDKKPFWNTKGEIDREWKDYLLDVAFQTMVVRAVMPTARVTPELCLVDKSKTCAEEAIYSKIRLADRDDNDRSAPRAVYVGDAAALQTQHFLAFVDVSDEVEYLLPQVAEAAGQYVEFLTTPNDGYKPPLGSHCKNCEYRGHGKTPDGFAECWGDLANAKPHVLDLFRIDTLGKREGLQKLIDQGISDSREIDDSLVNTESAYGSRQAMQLKAQRSNKEVVLSGIQDALTSCEYPLHFLDFETSSLPVPYHVGMNPYEKVAFQFSCHTIASPESTELTHSEWINVTDAYPSFEFASKLREVLGDKGTIFTWSPFEQTTIKDIVEQAKKYKFADAELIEWLDTVHIPCADGGRIQDLMKLCQAFYCHPEMNGRVGIKYVLKAIWKNNPHLWTDPWFSEYFAKDTSGAVLDPYLALSTAPFGYESEIAGTELEVVREGVGAMRAYQEMLYGQHRDDMKFRDAQRDLLLQYCKLDTAAMVIIWKHWMNAETV